MSRLQQLGEVCVAPAPRKACDYYYLGSFRAKLSNFNGLNCYVAFSQEADIIGKFSITAQVVLNRVQFGNRSLAVLT
jgi:hypothetical protein